MKKIKPVIQRDLKDCGVCSMAWIINYYDGYIALEKLREDTLTDLNGTTAYHIVEAFKKWGFDSTGILVNDLFSDKIKFPCIVHLSLENGLEHFVVVKEVSKNTVYIMDPGIGDTKMTIEKFSKLWTGHAILAYPREKIIKMDKELRISDLFMNIIKSEKSLVKKIIFTSIIWTILLIVSSYYLKVASGFIREDLNFLKIIIIIFCIIVILKVWTFFIRSYYENHLSNLVDVYIYPEFIRHLFFLPLRSIKTRTTGEIITRVGELGNIKNLFSDIFVSVFLDSLMILTSAIILGIINSKLFLILIISIIIYILVGIIISKIMFKKVLENIGYQTDFNSILVEYMEMFESVKNLNRTDIILNNIENKLSLFLLSNYEFVKFFNKSNFIKDAILEICIFLVNSLGMWLVWTNQLAIVDLFTFNIIISYCLDPVKNIINMLPKFNYIKATFSKIEEFIEINEEDIDYNLKLNIDGDITFDNVSYSYNNYDYLIKNYNLKINKGEHILLNGPSGVGKSTICKLLYREIEPSKGSISIGNINIKDYNLMGIRNSILYISQNEEIFTGSIKDNILLNRNVDDNTFYNICKLCEIEEIVNKKEMRYNALIDPSSKNISGGEKQRIILARGLLKSASIIILDEALSEVDEKLESKIIKNVRAHFKDKTIIYISHKQQNISFDKIINLGVDNEILQN